MSLKTHGFFTVLNDYLAALWMALLPSSYYFIGAWINLWNRKRQKRKKNWIYGEKEKDNNSNN